MKQNIFSSVLVFFYAFLCSQDSFAEDSNTVDFVETISRIEFYDREIYLNDDFTFETTTTIQVRAITEKAANSLKTAKLSYSTSVESLEVLEVYTVKSTGEKLTVDKNSYQQRIDKGNKGGGPVFSDRSTLRIVFPDFQEGDAYFLKSKLITSKPLFPGHFSSSAYFSQETAYDDAKITLNLPVDLDFQFQNRI